jgi:GH24 family phage-related lysozyme (muramidase)
MRTSRFAQEKIKKHEGFRAIRYIDPAGVATIGYGHTSTADRYTQITREQADILFARDIAEVDKKLNAWMRENRIWLTQPQYDALASFVFNVGHIPQSITNRITKLQGIPVASTIMKYTYAGDQVQPGLVIRRKQEASQWNKIKYLIGFAIAGYFLHLHTPKR